MVVKLKPAMYEVRIGVLIVDLQLYLFDLSEEPVFRFDRKYGLKDGKVATRRPMLTSSSLQSSKPTRSKSQQ